MKMSMSLTSNLSNLLDLTNLHMFAQIVYYSCIHKVGFKTETVP